MTHAAPRRSSRFPKVWLIPLLAVVLTIGATSVGLLSRSILIDFVAWWPVWTVVMALGFVTRGRRIGAIRVSGLLSLLLLLFLGLFVFAHLRGWPVMPSSVERLVAVANADVTTAALSARMDGDLRIRTDGEGFLYTVAALRGGGDVGVPGAVEHSQGESVSVELVANPDPGLYQFAGWDIALSAAPVWTLSFRGMIDADMAGLRIVSLQVEGAGMVRIGGPEGVSPFSVDGDFVIQVPSGVPVRVVGPAEVPDDWRLFEGDIVSPTEGQGWVIAVAEASNVRIREG